MLESFCFVLLPLSAPFLILEYLVGVYHQHPLTVDGKYFPDGGFLFDLHTLWGAGHDLILGHSPYPFVYPAPAAFLMAPFGVLPFKVAVVVYSLVLVGAALLTLRVLGVSDWRCYGAALGTLAGTAAITTGSLSWLIALSAALAWRYRDRREADMEGDRPLSVRPAQQHLHDRRQPRVHDSVTERLPGRGPKTLTERGAERTVATAQRGSCRERFSRKPSLRGRNKQVNEADLHTSRSRLAAPNPRFISTGALPVVWLRPEGQEMTDAE